MRFFLTKIILLEIFKNCCKYHPRIDNKEAKLKGLLKFSIILILLEKYLYFNLFHFICYIKLSGKNIDWASGSFI